MSGNAKKAAILALWLGLVFCFGCELGPAEPGTFSATFAWSDPEPAFETWVHARVEQADGASRVQVAEAPLVPVSEGVALAFPSVQHGGPYRVVVEVKAVPDKRARALYFGESKPFHLRPNRHTKVDVALSLTAAPSVADTVDRSGAVSIVSKNALGYVRESDVTISLAPRGATRLIAANDFALDKGRTERDLEGLRREGERYLLEWDLDKDLCARPPCPDGTRVVFVQFLNERGYPSEVLSTSVDLDRVAPDVAAASLAPSPARAGAKVTLVLNPTEPLAEPPQLSVSPRDPGFGPFVQVPGGGYVTEYVASSSESPRELLEFDVQLTDRAGHRVYRQIEPQLLIDTRAPGLAWGVEVVPPVVSDGENYRLTFDLDEAVAALPIVRVGSTAVACVFNGPTLRAVECTHVAAKSEGSGERAIEIEVSDVAGNTSILRAGSVLYDTLPRCGDGILAEDQLEVCDEGSANSDAANADCRTDCRPRRCGDRIVDFQHGEVCDDGNNNAGDGCASDCISDETCGNALLEGQFGEECDDGNLLSHDGCSSSCQTETFVSGMHDGWYLEEDAPRTYNSRRRRHLVFTEGVLLELGKQGWRRVSSAVNPRPDAMAYDATRDRVVLWDYTGLLEWHAQQWSRPQGLDSMRPSTRSSPAMTYVASKAHTLVFGGTSGGTTALNDLWSWDGRFWDELIPMDGVRPPARNAVMAYDPKRDRVVLVARSGAKGAPNHTWEWDGERWHQMQPMPTPAYSAQITYDVAKERMVVVARPLEDDELDEDEPEPYPYPYPDRRWEWDGARWEEFALEEAIVDDLPPPALGAAAVYESALVRGVLFGGYAPASEEYRDDELETYYDRTWVQSESRWTLLAVEGVSPPPRAFATMAHDPLRGVSVLFGGQVGTDQPCDGACEETTPLADTWELRGNRWQRVEADRDTPPAGSAAEMFFDIARKRFTLFARTEEGTLGVWHRDSTGWSRALPLGESPRARTHFAVAYDPVRARAVLFGGEFNDSGITVPLGDTWEWDGSRFLRIATTRPPAARSGHAMTYHATRGTVLLYGGSTLQGVVQDVWEWNGATWRDLEVNQLDQEFLPAVEHHALFFDSESHAAISVGGQDGTDPGGIHAGYFEAEPFSESCATDLTDCPPLEAAEEVCVDGEDGDRDGLAGCMDPDCYARCFSSCNPVFMSCEGLLPYCGDGTCSERESCDLCPADCGRCAGACGDFTCAEDETALACPGDCTR